jgi:hypothetical protein
MFVGDILRREPSEIDTVYHAIPSYASSIIRRVGPWPSARSSSFTIP